MSPDHIRVAIAGLYSFPRIEGLESFDGTYFHSAAWDHSHDLIGKKVAVADTGASAIQLIPHIQPQAEGGGPHQLARVAARATGEP